MCAVVSGNLEVIKLLVDRGADVDVMRDGGSTALSIAINCQDRELIEYLTPLTSAEIKSTIV
jgi:ankyrin repeat protein